MQFGEVDQKIKLGSTRNQMNIKNNQIRADKNQNISKGQLFNPKGTATSKDTRSSEGRSKGGGEAGRNEGRKEGRKVVMFHHIP